MPVNRNSRMRQHRKHIHGWKEGDRFFLSLQPKPVLKPGEIAPPSNSYAFADDALREASRRGIPIVWDDPAVIA